jgi:hypothetical protein
VPTITATADSAKSQVRLDLDFSDIDTPYALVNRVDPITGATTQVRGHGASFTANGIAYTTMFAGYKGVLYDTEAPLDSAVYYTASGIRATLNANPTFSGGYTDPWFVTDPAITMRITANAAGTNFLSFTTGGATLNPAIRAEDIPATPGTSFIITAVMSANVAQNVTAGMTFRDATGAILTSNSSTSTVLGAVNVIAVGTAPANTVTVQPFMTMVGTPAATTVVSASSVTLVNFIGSATSAGVTLPSLGACQLKDPLRPGSNVRVDFFFDPNPKCTPTEGVFWQSMDVEQKAANAAVFNVNNQVFPVVVSKVRSAAVNTLTLVSRTFADTTRLDTLLAPGSPVLFQVPDEYGLPDQYLSIGNSSVARVLPDHRIPIRVFSLPHSVTAAPGGFMQGTVGARWADTCNRYANWGAVNSAGLTWIQVLDGLAG